MVALLRTGRSVTLEVQRIGKLVIALAAMLHGACGGAEQDDPPLEPSATTQARGTSTSLPATATLTPTPTEDRQSTYEVQSGDSWWAIAQRHEVTMEDLLEANGHSSPPALHPGTILLLPLPERSQAPSNGQTAAQPNVPSSATVRAPDPSTSTSTPPPTTEPPPTATEPPPTTAPPPWPTATSTQVPASGGLYSLAQIDGRAILVASDGTYLGLISSNRYSSDSICNRYGDYGSRYASLSIRNQYGDYGSRYASVSA